MMNNTSIKFGFIGTYLETRCFKILFIWHGTAKNDVNSPTCHICCYGHSTFFTCKGNNFSFPDMIFGV